MQFYTLLGTFNLTDKDNRMIEILKNNNIELIKGDCLDAMKVLEDNSIDAIICDPPYGTTLSKWDKMIPVNEMWEQLNRIIKPDGAIVLFGVEPFSSHLRLSNPKNYKYDWVWDKKRGANFAVAKYVPMKTCENIMVFSNMRATTGGKKGLETMKYNPQGLKDCDIDYDIKIKNTVGKKKKGQTSFKHTATKTGFPKCLISFPLDRGGFHPTQKPIALMEYLIKTYTNENETVLDFTMGSGSTGVAAKQTNRKFIGIEQDEKYFKIAQERINSKLF
jgi:site-specific DNA-methyltransferase (adenine-specific)